MIIELQNFGPIKSFKFDTSKDMHAIFGKNNIGKSYAISAVYLILKGLREYDKSSEYFNFKDKAIIDELIKKIKELENKGNNVNITSQIEMSLAFHLEETFTKSLEKSFRNSYLWNNLSNYFANERFKIILNLDIVLIEITVDQNIKSIQKFKVENITFKQSNQFNLTLNQREIFKFNINNDFIPQILTNESDYTIFAEYVIVMSIYEFIVKSKISSEHIYYLPASRSGLYNTLNSFGPIIAELSRNRNFITHKIEIPSLSEPILDYFLNLNTIDKAQANEHYLTHFEEIEQEILKGKITLDDETKKYYYVPTDSDMRLELSFTSSMISEIAPIIAHLKYIIPLESDKPSILFIEEPEAHLHPEIQILLLEYFVKLSKGNVKIVMTSHSNYIFNKLSNLLIANKIDKEKLSVSLMKMTPEGSVIEEGAMQMDEYGIEDNNFVDVAEQLYEERMSLLEKL